MSAWGEPKRRDPLSGALGFLLLLAVLALSLLTVLWKLWTTLHPIGRLHGIVNEL